MLLVAALVLLAVSSATAGAKLVARGSAEQVYVTGAKTGQTLTLVRRGGTRAATLKAGSLGGAIFRNVTPGSGYRVRGATTTSPPLTVLSNAAAPPSTKVYGQKIPSDGYGYITMRDGTKLAMAVHLPSGTGPFPTLIEYSGYGYAREPDPQSSIAAVANLLGFAVVDVNMRGTGCSGGAFDYFEALQNLDGYDVIETVARQPWVLHNKVGMMGVSYGAISQLFVAQLNPPHLAAIAPLSVIDNTATTLYPGGILNTGFALSWAKERVHDALPASPTGGQAWAYALIKKGDQTCKANQVLHAEAIDLLKKTYANHFYVPKVADPLSPITFVDKIKVPVFLACQFTDEQTGGHCPDLAQHFTSTTKKWFTFTNGVHTDSLDPATFNRWYDFLQLYVTKVAPNMPAAVKAAAPVVYKSALGIDGVTLPADPLQGQPTYAAALTAFDSQPRVRIRFDNGAGGSPGFPYDGFEQSFSKFPIPGTRATSWYFGTGGALSTAAPTSADTDTFTVNKAARPANDFSGDTGSGDLWTATPTFNWLPNPAGTAVTYVTPPLTINTTVIGAGAVQAWIKSSAPDVDLQATISEVRPDGKETFVQNGWLRASMRTLDTSKSTLLEPVLSLAKADASPLPKGTWTNVTIPLYYQGHAYRVGSRLRVTISSVNGDQPIWAFANTVPAKGTPTVAVAHSESMPSRVVLPVVPGVAVPTPLPPCPSLRNEPCRTYVPSLNQTAVAAG